MEKVKKAMEKKLRVETKIIEQTAAVVQGCHPDDEARRRDPVRQWVLADAQIRFNHMVEKPANRFHVH